MRYLFEIFIWVLLFLAVRSILGSIASGSRRQRPAPGPQPSEPGSAPAGGELKKDPVCGTYVSVETSVKRVVNGETMHFCSPECRDRYQPS